MFDYTAIVVRLKTVTWSNYSQPTSVWLAVLLAQPSHSPTHPCNQTDIHLYFVTNHP